LDCHALLLVDTIRDPESLRTESGSPRAVTFVCLPPRVSHCPANQPVSALRRNSPATRRHCAVVTARACHDSCAVVREARPICWVPEVLHAWSVSSVTQVSAAARGAGALCSAQPLRKRKLSCGASYPARSLALRFAGRLRLTGISWTSSRPPRSWWWKLVVARMSFGVRRMRGGRNAWYMSLSSDSRIVVTDAESEQIGVGVVGATSESVRQQQKVLEVVSAIVEQFR